MSGDPWAHRAEGMRCATCMWHAEKPGGQLGRCRRHAPTMNGYPVVYPTDWCGDHKLDETKLTEQTDELSVAKQIDALRRQRPAATSAITIPGDEPLPTDGRALAEEVIAAGNRTKASMIADFTDNELLTELARRRDIKNFFGIKTVVKPARYGDLMNQIPPDFKVKYSFGGEGRAEPCDGGFVVRTETSHGAVSGPESYP